jgi:hypothetical protein
MSLVDTQRIRVAGTELVVHFLSRRYSFLRENLIGKSVSEGGMFCDKI